MKGIDNIYMEYSRKYKKSVKNKKTTENVIKPRRVAGLWNFEQFVNWAVHIDKPRVQSYI